MSKLLEEALDETTPSERLRELAASSQMKTRFAVAQNPNTPVDVLITLFSEAPLDVLNNPVIPLLLLENPCLFEDLCKSNKRIFQQFELPNFFLHWALNNSKAEIKASLAISPKIPLSFLIKLAEDKEPIVRIAVAKNLSTPVNILKKLSEDNYLSVRYEVASNPNTPKNILENFVLNGGEEISCIVLRNPMAIYRNSFLKLYCHV